MTPNELNCVTLGIQIATAILQLILLTGMIINLRNLRRRSR